MKLLLVEDDRALAKLVVRELERAGFVVDVEHDGAAGLTRLTTSAYDIAIVDGMLPSLDGVDLIRSARATVQTPLLLLTARDGVSDRVKGLDAGADDYVGKPFAIEELIARLHALLRRAAPTVDDVLRFDDVAIDLARREVTRAGAVVALTTKQFALLTCLARKSGAVASRTLLLEQVFGYHFDPGTNIVDVHVRQLRQRIDRDGEPSLIEAVRGVGYRLAAPKRA